MLPAGRLEVDGARPSAQSTAQRDQTSDHPIVKKPLKNRYHLRPGLLTSRRGCLACRYIEPEFIEFPTLLTGHRLGDVVHAGGIDTWWTVQESASWLRTHGVNVRARRLERLARQRVIPGAFYRGRWVIAPGTVREMADRAHSKAERWSQVEPVANALKDAVPLPDAKDLRPLAAVMNALSTPRRLAVVQRLIKGQATVGDLNTAAGGSVTSDLDLLVRSGIAERVRVEGSRWPEVRLVDRALDQVGELLHT